MQSVRKYWYVFWTECGALFLDCIRPLIDFVRWLRGNG
ncbi:hypothetical protein P3T20_001253 [Paraburkholderia sp. GAS206C]